MKPILVSGIQPSGRLHIGNYLGALKNFVDLQNSGKYECYFFIADLHSLTEPFDPEEKSEQILETTAEYLAGGIVDKKSTIFQQSQVPAHTELSWILGAITPVGELRRMTQFKDKSGEQRLSETASQYDKNKNYSDKELKGFLAVLQASRIVWQETNAGLFTYPILMAADILLYDAKFVPVGEDQLQHLELTRALARKFNARFGKTFIEPQPILTKTPRVMSLKNPEKKMSKSDPQGCLFIDDSPEEIRAKIARATTDSGSEISYDTEKKAGLSNLIDIYATLSHMEPKLVVKEFAGQNYAHFKSRLVELVSENFADFRKQKKSLMAKPQTLVAILKSGSAKAAEIAEKKILEVKEKIGVVI